MDFYQPVEQAGFRKGFSTIDHLQTVKTLIEKCEEYNQPLHLCFVDFHKPFDTVELWAVLKALRDARIDLRYSKLLENIYLNATMPVGKTRRRKKNQQDPDKTRDKTGRYYIP